MKKRFLMFAAAVVLAGFCTACAGKGTQGNAGEATDSAGKGTQENAEESTESAEVTVEQTMVYQINDDSSASFSFSGAGENIQAETQK